MLNGYGGLSPLSMEERPPLPGFSPGFHDSEEWEDPDSASLRPGSGRGRLSPLRNYSGSFSGSFASGDALSPVQISPSMMASMMHPPPQGTHRQLHRGPLDPSFPTSPVPEMSDLYMQEDPPAPQLRGCQILLPSWGAANDSMRIRNNGRATLRLRAPLMPMMPRLVERRLLDPEILHSYSEPTLPSASSTSPPSVSMQGRMLAAKREAVKSPRGMRGTVRKASRVVMQYPELNPFFRSGLLSPSKSELSSTSRSTLRKKVSWSDSSKSLPVGRNADDLAKFARLQSSHKQNAMYFLRRAGQNPDSDEGEEFVAPTPAPAPVPKMTEAERLIAMAKGELTDKPEAPVPPSDAEGAEGNLAELSKASGSDASPKSSSPRDEDMPLMAKTLLSLTDTEADLRRTEQGLVESVGPCIDYGGARHPTTMLASRALEVVKRKADVLQKVEERLNLVRQHWENRERLAKEVADGGSPPPEMQHIRKFYMAFVHKDNFGNVCEPIDADKSNFESFCASFGLPRQHASFEELRFLAREMCKWWSQESLRMAMEGADPDIIARLMAVVDNVGREKGGAEEEEEIEGSMGEARGILGDMLADKVLKAAQALKDKDEFASASNPEPMPEKAREYANQINADIKQATKLGAPTSHESLKKAKMIATWFEREEIDRLAMRAWRNAEKIKAKDAEYAVAFEKRDGVPPVGSAADAATKVEQEIKTAKEKGVPADHETLGECKELASELRALDGERKRLVNRAKRLAAEAKKNAG